MHNIFFRQQKFHQLMNFHLFLTPWGEDGEQKLSWEVFWFWPGGFKWRLHFWWSSRPSVCIYRATCVENELLHIGQTYNILLLTVLSHFLVSTSNEIYHLQNIFKYLPSYIWKLCLSILFWSLITVLDIQKLSFNCRHSVLSTCYLSSSKVL